MLAAQARLGMSGEARAAFAALDDEQASAGEIGNARAAICLAEGDPAAALGALKDVLDGTAPVIGYLTVVEAHLLAGMAHRELGDQRAANRAAEHALALAEPDRPVLPFLMTGSRGLLRPCRSARPGTPPCSPTSSTSCTAYPRRAETSTFRRRRKSSARATPVLRYLPTNLSRPEIATELSVSPNTVSTHIRSIYAKLQVGYRSSAVQRARELRLLSPAALARGPPDPGDADSPASLRPWLYAPGTSPITWPR